MCSNKKEKCCPEGKVSNPRLVAGGKVLAGTLSQGTGENFRSVCQFKYERALNATQEKRY